MNPTLIKSLSGDQVSISPDHIEKFEAALRGQVYRPSDAIYEQARVLWNGMIDRHPALVVRAAGVRDVMQSVDFAREHGALLTIKGGGHQIAGHAAADGAIMLDLSTMRSIRVDPDARMAWVEPGATLGDLDHETQVFGLAASTGINSTTGIAGLTLGGGYGWLTRKHGMTIDSLISVDVVTADGRFRRANATSNDELFWAVRGGGGNFGVITSFEFELQSVGPTVFAGLIIHPIDDAPDLLRAYRQLAADAPDDLTVWAVLRAAPPLPFLPESSHGYPMLALAVCHCGTIEEAEKDLAPFRDLGAPIGTALAPTPYVAWQSFFDPMAGPGARNYWKSNDFDTLSDDLIDALVGAAKALPGPECDIYIAHVGGAMARVPTGATAYPRRDAHFMINFHTRWREAKDDARFVKWTRALFDRTATSATGSVYINFMPDDEQNRVSGAYGENMARLEQVKRRYDPDNLFRVNHNIAPAPADLARP